MLRDIIRNDASHFMPGARGMSWHKLVAQLPPDPPEARGRRPERGAGGRVGAGEGGVSDTLSRRRGEESAEAFGLEACRCFITKPSLPSLLGIKASRGKFTLHYPSLWPRPESLFCF